MEDRFMCDRITALFPRFGVVPLMLALIATGCDTSPSATPSKAGAQETSKQAPPTTASADPPAPKPADTKADFPAMTAEELTKEFAANEATAKKKYTGKSVVVEGVVVEKQGDEINGAHLTLKGHKNEKETFNVHCGLAVIDNFTASQLKKLKVGDKVKINGDGPEILDRKAGEPILVWMSGCKIVK
jgi:tRNA_anti-like